MKGQYFSFDAIIASVIFLMAVVMLLGYWHSVKLFLDYQSGSVSKEAMRVASALFVPGFPEGASCDTMVNLGFATSWDERLINETTLLCAEEEAADDEEWLKEKFATPYDVSIHVAYGDDELWIGDDEPSSESEIVKMRRGGTVIREDGTTALAVLDIFVYR